MSLRVIRQIPIDASGTTVLRLPITTRVFDAVMNGRNLALIRLVINTPKDSLGETSREFLVGTSPMELEQGHYAFIRSLDRGDGVILHVFEKVSGR